MKEKRKRFIQIFALALIMLLIASASYAYFAAHVGEASSTDISIISSSSIAMMIETEAGSGQYEMSTDISWPDSSEYTFNSTLSNCENGSTLSWDSETKSVIMTGSVSDKCYVYFDLIGYTTLQAVSSTYFEKIWGYKSSITKIVFDDGGGTIDEYDYVYDISEKENNSILAYLVNNGDDTYTTYIVSNGEIYANVDMNCWFWDFEILEEIVGLDKINTSNVTNMKFLFQNCISMTELDLSSWDTSNVTDMSYMFSVAQASSTSKLESIIFGDNWDTSSVTTMYAMFYGSSLTTLDLSGFDTSNVTDMKVMFYKATSLTSLDVSSFNTSKVTNMSGMFGTSSGDMSLTSITFGDGWDTSNVTDMSYMFQNCKSLISLDLSNWDTSKVTAMNEMFYDCSSLTSLDLSSFDTSNVTTMYYMFYNCSSLTTLDLSSFDTSNVTNMISMFQNCSSLISLDMSNADFSNVTSYTQMFRYNNSSITVTVKDSDAYDFIIARLNQYNGGTVVIA